MTADKVPVIKIIEEARHLNFKSGTTPQKVASDKVDLGFTTLLTSQVISVAFVKSPTNFARRL